MRILDGKNSVDLHHGDMMEVLKSIPDNSIDSVVTDPPYHLTSIVKRFGSDNAAPAKSNGASGVYERSSRGFMGKVWDGGDISFRPETWAEVMRVLKPGGHLVAFGAPKNSHRLACAIEDAGFEIRDSIFWCFGSGFPKSLNVSKEIHKQDGVCRCAAGEDHMPCLRDGEDHPACVEEKEQERLLQPILPGEGPSAPSCAVRGEHEGAEAERPALRSGEPGMEGWRDPPEAAGQLRQREIRQMPAGVLVDGEDGRVCDGAPSGHGAVGGEATVAGGVRSPQESSTTGKRSGKSRTVAGQPKPQVSGTWPLCGRCGKPIIPDGLGTALKPAYEPIILARKPLIGTVAETVLAHGTGALNIDACRVGTDGGGTHCSNRDETGKCLGHPDRRGTAFGLTYHGPECDEATGRWPANLVHDGSEDVLAGFPDRKTTWVAPEHANNRDGDFLGALKHPGHQGFNDTGSAARFFYCAKANKADRAGSKHPTVKPIALMRWLVRLVTPPGGVVLDPFAGTGTTGMAANLEGFNTILIEREDEYVDDIKNRFGSLSDNNDDTNDDNVEQLSLMGVFDTGE